MTADVEDFDDDNYDNYSSNSRGSRLNPANYVPNVGAKVANNMTDANQIVLATGLAFLVSGISNSKRIRKKDGTIDLLAIIQGFGGVNLAAWVVIFVTLIVASDIPTTSRVAGPFAWLICIGTLSARGDKFFKRVNEFVGAAKTLSSPEADNKDTGDN